VDCPSSSKPASACDTEQVTLGRFDLQASLAWKLLFHFLVKLLEGRSLNGCSVTSRVFGRVDANPLEVLLEPSNTVILIPFSEATVFRIVFADGNYPLLISSNHLFLKVEVLLEQVVLLLLHTLPVLLPSFPRKFLLSSAALHFSLLSNPKLLHIGTPLHHLLVFFLPGAAQLPGVFVHEGLVVHLVGISLIYWAKGFHPLVEEVLLLFSFHLLLQPRSSSTRCCLGRGNRAFGLGAEHPPQLVEDPERRSTVFVHDLLYLFIGEFHAELTDCFSKGLLHHRKVLPFSSQVRFIHEFLLESLQEAMLVKQLPEQIPVGKVTLKYLHLPR